MTRDCATTRISASELVSLLDTMTPTERQTATTQMAPLRALELSSVPEPIDGGILATGSSDIRSSEVSAHTIDRQTAHLPMTIRPPARPSTPPPFAEAPAAQSVIISVAPMLPAVMVQPPAVAETPPASQLTWSIDTVLLASTFGFAIAVCAGLFVAALA